MLNVKKLLTKLVDNCNCDLLYNGSTSGNATLSKSVANYNKIIVHYVDNDGTYLTREFVTNGVSQFNACLDSVRITGSTYIKGYIGTFNGTALTKGWNKQWALGGTPADGNYIIIKKIYGCKNIAGGGTS